MVTCIVCTYVTANTSSTGTNRISELTLTQTVTLDGTNVTVNGISDKVKILSDKVTGESFFDPNILVQAFMTVPYMSIGTLYRDHKYSHQRQASPVV